MQDSILFWNAVTLEANRVSHSDPGRRQQTGPALSSRAIAIVHLAMYDAYAAIAASSAYPRYLPTTPAAPTGTPSARDAVAGAAFRTLSVLYDAQRDFFEAQLSAFDRKSDSFRFGEEIGQMLLDLRANDMDARDGGYLPSPDRFRHRRDPDNPGQGFHAPFYGAQTRTFAVKERHTLDAPPGRKNFKRYEEALDDVRARGIRPDLTATLPDRLFARRRSAEQTLIGIYWGYDGANRLGTPPRLYNQIIRQVAMNIPNPATGKVNDEGQNARLFAFVNAALGDAGILAWEQKYCHDFWRPVVGIREHDETMGPVAPHKGETAEFADGDPGWLPLGAPSTNSQGMKNFTPDFPAYPSGHATFGAAALHITRMFYGVGAKDKKKDKLFPNEFVSEEYNGISRDNDGTVRPRHTRRFPDGLWGMILENATSRVYLGVHWIFDAFDFTVAKTGLEPDLGNERIGGVGLGLRIARDVFAHGGGKAPQMTPAAVEPPIETPEPGAAMPAKPKQPASVNGCIDEKTGKEAVKGAAPEQQPVERAWPSGISEK